MNNTVLDKILNKFVCIFSFALVMAGLGYAWCLHHWHVWANINNIIIK